MADSYSCVQSYASRLVAGLDTGIRGSGSPNIKEVATIEGAVRQMSRISAGGHLQKRRYEPRSSLNEEGCRGAVTGVERPIQSTKRELCRRASHTKFRPISRALLDLPRENAEHGEAVAPP